VQMTLPATVCQLFCLVNEKLVIKNVNLPPCFDANCTNLQLLIDGKSKLKIIVKIYFLLVYHKNCGRQVGLTLFPVGNDHVLVYMFALSNFELQEVIISPSFLSAESNLV